MQINKFITIKTCIAPELSIKTSAACFKARLALCSPSAEITFERRFIRTLSMIITTIKSMSMTTMTAIITNMLLCSPSAAITFEGGTNLSS